MLCWLWQCLYRSSGRLQGRARFQGSSRLLGPVHILSHCRLLMRSDGQSGIQSGCLLNTQLVGYLPSASGLFPVRLLGWSQSGHKLSIQAIWRRLVIAGLSAAVGLVAFLTVRVAWAEDGCSACGVGREALPSVVQSNIAGTVGVTGRDLFGEVRLHLGLRGDVLFGRSSPWDFGAGPYAEVVSALDDLSLGGGVSALVPIDENFPVVLSFGGYGRYWSGAWGPGLTGQLFWGTRSFNYHSWYGMALGISLQGRVGVGELEERAIVVALHIEGIGLAMPLVYLINAFRGGAN